MNRLALLLLIVVAFAFSVCAQPPDYFHNNDEIYDFLTNLQNAHPTRISIDSVGHGQADHRPIYLVKVSNDVQINENKPTTLLIGQIHAEEISGIEVVLAAIEELVTSDNSQIRRKRAELEMYFIPTLNPDGLSVVFDADENLPLGSDITFRKNKRCVTGDDQFHYMVSSWGNDTSGVDLNRNFDINFFHGDSLFEVRGTTNELYDYYRGEYPHSEPEIQCLERVLHEINPLYSITYHESRTGSFSEKVYYAWDWGLNGDKLPPDDDILSDVNTNFAFDITTQAGSNTYLALRSGGRNGKMHDWMYAEGGWINCQTEIGSGIQPEPESVLDEIIDAQLPAVYGLLDRARGAMDLGVESGHLMTTVKDENNEPIVAEVLLPERHNGYLKPRMTDSTFGTQRRALLSRSYDVITRAWGYVADTSNVFVGENGATQHNVTLQDKERYNVNINCFGQDNNTPLGVDFILKHEYGSEELSVNESAQFSWPTGRYELEFRYEEDDYLPRRVVLNITDSDVNLSVGFAIADTHQIATFENEIPQDIWSSSGDFDWVRSGSEAYISAYSLKSSADRFIEASQSGTVTATYAIPQDAQSIFFSGYRAFELEPDFDFCDVEYSIDGSDWEQLEVLNGFKRWEHFFYDFEEAVGATDLAIRWSITTDGTDIDRGLFLDNAGLITSVVSSIDEGSELPSVWNLHPAYPNPFNPSTTIRFDVAKTSAVKLVVYDLLGREVTSLVDGNLSAGKHQRVLDLNASPSGIYFIKMDAENYSNVQKVVLLK
jgi:murein tripeptide amidase MpaA